MIWYQWLAVMMAATVGAHAVPFVLLNMWRRSIGDPCEPVTPKLVEIAAVTVLTCMAFYGVRF